MKIKKIYTDYAAEQEIRKIVRLKYYIRGRWLIERRKEWFGPIIGSERRISALSEISEKLPNRDFI